jgi:hypothetical protein
MAFPGGSSRDFNIRGAQNSVNEILRNRVFHRGSTVPFASRKLRNFERRRGARIREHSAKAPIRSKTNAIDATAKQSKRSACDPIKPALQRGRVAKKSMLV